MIAFIDRHRDHFGVEAICRVLGATERGFLTSAATVPRSSARHRPERSVTRCSSKWTPLDSRRELRRLRVSEDASRDAPCRMGSRPRPDRSADESCWSVRDTPWSKGVHGRAPLVAWTVVLIWSSGTSRLPDRISSGSLTSPYVRIPSGFCYTAFITDVFTRRIVGRLGSGHQPPH